MQAERTNPLALTSPKNPLIKEIRKAAARGSLTESGFALAEGYHLLEEAARSGCGVQAVIAAESAAGRAAAPEGARLLVVPDRLFDELASTESPQGVLTLVMPPVWTYGDVFSTNPLLVILDAIQEPGNAGAIVRSAEAFGATVVALRGTVNLWNPKALRASAGSMFRVPYLAGLTAGSAAALLAEHEVTAYTAMPGTGQRVSARDLRGPAAFVAGSEGQGIQTALGPPIRIPTRGVESLNVAVATGILLYEARRQRDA